MEVVDWSGTAGQPRPEGSGDAGASTSGVRRAGKATRASSAAAAAGVARQGGGVQKKSKLKQSKLPGAQQPVRACVNVLAGKSRGGAGSAAILGEAGRKIDWIHGHWEPVEKEKYKNTAADKLPAALRSDKAMMQCLHCQAQCSFNPSTNFKVHLLTACTPFAASEHWNSDVVVGELAKRASAARQTVRQSTAQNACSCVVGTAPFN